MRVFTDKKTGDQYVEIPTRAPTKMQIYSKTLAYASDRTLKAMYKDAAERFFREKPWEHGLKWRPTKGLTTTLKDTVGQKEATGWMQINMRFPVELGNALERLAAEQKVSLSSVAYTMLYWWTWWVYPPASEKKRRESFLWGQAKSIQDGPTPQKSIQDVQAPQNHVQDEPKSQKIRASSWSVAYCRLRHVAGRFLQRFSGMPQGTAE